MKTVDVHSDVLLAYSEVADGNMDVRFGSPAEVKKNRQAFYSQIGVSASEIIEGEQIHFNRLLILNKDNAKMWHGQIITGVDGFLTNVGDITLLLRLADCIPVVIYDPVKKALALVHAGWRGIVEGIHTSAVARMNAAYKSEPGDMVVWLGPSAKKCCYVHQEVPEALNQPEWIPYHEKKSEGISIDLTSYVKDSLDKAGVSKKNIIIDKRCTIEDSSLFSHQRTVASQEKEGRFAVVAKIR